LGSKKFIKAYKCRREGSQNVSRKGSQGKGKPNGRDLPRKIIKEREGIVMELVTQLKRTRRKMLTLPTRGGVADLAITAITEGIIKEILGLEKIT